MHPQSGGKLLMTENEECVIVTYILVSSFDLRCEHVIYSGCTTAQRFDPPMYRGVVCACMCVCVCVCVTMCVCHYVCMCV